MLQISHSLSSEVVISLYRTMQIIRQTEEELARCHQRGIIHGACHTYVGQEAIASGVCSHLNENDPIFSTHRGHGHALAKGMPPSELMAELFGRSTGCSRGRGGSMHLFSPEIGMMGPAVSLGHVCYKRAAAVTVPRYSRTAPLQPRSLAMVRSTTVPFMKGSIWPASGSYPCCSSARTINMPPKSPSPIQAVIPVSDPEALPTACLASRSMGMT